MEIKKYFALVWHWAWLILLGGIAAGGLAFLYSSNSTPVFSANAKLLIDQAPGDGSYGELLRNERLSTTYVELIKVSPVLQETIERLNLPYDEDQLARMLATSAPLDTQIINIVVEDTSAGRAQEIANTVATVFINFLSEQQGSRFETALARFDAERQEVGNEIQRLETEINQLLEIADRSPEEEALLSRIETQLKEQQSIYNQIFNDAQTLRIEASTRTNNVVLVEPAKINPRPIRPRTLQNTLLAGMVGIMLTLGLIFLRDYLDDTIKTPDHVQEETNLSTIGVISYIKTDNNQPSSRLITHLVPRAPTSEAYRMLRTNLEFSSIDQKLRRLVITSSSPGEGKSTTAANLGTVLAQAGNRVILIDSDLRRPTQHHIFEVPNNQGLTTALLDNETPVSYHTQSTRVPGLRLMTSGPLPPNPAELLNSQRMANILNELHKEADIIVLDTPPVLTVADATILSQKADGVVLVAKIGATTRQGLVQAFQTLKKSSVATFGVVLNKATQTRGYSYEEYYYRNYNYEYGPEGAARRFFGRLPKWLVGTK